MQYVGKKGSDWDVFNLVTSGISKQRYRASIEYSCPLRMSWSYSPSCPPAPAGSSFKCFPKHRRNKSTRPTLYCYSHGESPLGPQDITQRLTPPWALLHLLNCTVFVYNSHNYNLLSSLSNVFSTLHLCSTTFG